MSAGDSTDASSRGSPQPPQRSFWGFIQAHKMDDLSTKLRKEPCAREGYLYGMSIGVGVAVLRFVKKGSLLSAGNWGVVAFAVGSVVSKKLCCFQRAHYHAKVNTLLEKHLSPTSQGHVDGFEDSQQPIAGDSSKKEPPS